MKRRKRKRILLAVPLLVLTAMALAWRALEPAIEAARHPSPVSGPVIK